MSLPAKCPDERLAGAAGAIVDLWLGNRLTADWRDRLDESDFLESADWETAVRYAAAVLTYLDTRGAA